MPSDIYPLIMHRSARETIYSLLDAARGYVISDDKKSSGFGSPEALDLFQKLRYLVENNLVVPPSTLSQGKNTHTQLFFGEKAAMWLNGLVYDMHQ